MKDIATERFYFSDIVAAGWSVYKAIFRKAIPILLTVMLPVNWLTEYAITRVNFAALIEAGKLTELQAAKIQMQIGNFIQMLIGSIALLALMKLAETNITRRDVTWQEALTHGIRRYPTLLWTGFLFGLRLLLACAVCGIPMWFAARYNITVVAIVLLPFMFVAICYLSGIYLFFPYAVGLTSANARKSLSYSKKLVRGQFWRVAAYMFGIGIVSGLFSLLTASVGMAASSAISHIFSNIPLPVAVIVEGICDFTGDFAMPFQMAMLTIFFLNTAYLKDGVN